MFLELIALKVLAAPVWTVYPAQGSVVSGHMAWLELVSAEPGTPPLPVADQGQILGPLEPLGPDRWRVAYQAPSNPGADILTLDGVAFPIAVVAPPAAPPPLQVDALVGVESLDLLVPLAGVGPEDVLIRSSEGNLSSIKPVEGGITVRLLPSDSKNPRLVVVSVLDLRDPAHAPQLILVRLKARQQATITADPGSEVLLKVGGRSWGPVTVNAQGEAQVVFEVPPGTRSYEILVTDPAGNTQKLPSGLPGPFPPVLAAIEAPRPEGGTDAWLLAWSSTGSPWTGEAPLCRYDRNEPVPAVLVSRGLYRFDTALNPPPDARSDVRLECTLQEANARLRLPTPGAGPARIELKVYPEAISADFPIADLQATLLDGRGDQLPPDGLQLLAGGGVISELDTSSGSLRAEYRAETALQRGQDSLMAAWYLPEGSGNPWNIQAWGKQGMECTLMARVLDRQGRPLSQSPVFIDGEGPFPTDEHGWLTHTLPSCSLHRFSAGEVSRWLAPTPASSLPDIKSPDLQASLVLPIQAGRIHQLSLEVSPRPLTVGSPASLVISLLDIAGSPVLDEPLTLSASEGSCSTPVQQNGVFVAVFTPGPGQQPRKVRITASTPSASVSTEVDLISRPVRGSMMASTGVISNFNGIVAPAFWIATDNRLPARIPAYLQLHTGLGTYHARIPLEHPTSGESIQVDAQFILLELGMVAIQRPSRFSLQAGLSAIFVPYLLDVSFGGQQGISGLALSTPGVSLQAGAGYRLGSSELALDMRYLIFTAPGDTVRFEGTPGGLAISLGYRILY
jgi:hypothetical protein